MTSTGAHDCNHLFPKGEVGDSAVDPSGNQITVVAMYMYLDGQSELVNGCQSRSSLVGNQPSESIKENGRTESISNS
jgi:hypothetical protein